MTRLDEIKAAIDKLTLSERAELARWLHGWEDDQWDNQIRNDIGRGKLDSLLAEVDEDADADRLREMP